ncbi:hypothetical protein EV127DRAFT_417410 [Xylaria flabelliformis]|nr:hypothetical protein EV127DRAFT_417410 [Xylaria flabelliformis]
MPTKHHQGRRQDAMDYVRRVVLERTHLKAQRERIEKSKQNLFRFRLQAHPSWFRQGAAATTLPAIPDHQIALLENGAALVRGNFAFQTAFQTVGDLDTSLAERPLNIDLTGLLLLALNHLQTRTSQFEESYARVRELQPGFTSEGQRRIVKAAPQRAYHSLLVGNTTPLAPSPLRQITGVHDDDSWDVAADNENISWEDYVKWGNTASSEGW